MELGMIGFGRMGTNMVLRLQKAGHHCVVYDTIRKPCRRLRKKERPERPRSKILRGS